MIIFARYGSPHKGRSDAVLKTMQEENPGIDFKILRFRRMTWEIASATRIR